MYLYFWYAEDNGVPGWEPELFAGNVRLTVWKKEYGAENESIEVNGNCFCWERWDKNGKLGIHGKQLD